VGVDPRATGLFIGAATVGRVSGACVQPAVMTTADQSHPETVARTVFITTT